MRLPRRDQGRGARHYCCLRDPWPAGRLLAPGPNAGSQGWCSSSDDDDHFQGTGSHGQRPLKLWISCSSQPPPPPDDRVPTVPPASLPPVFQSRQSLMPTVRSLVSLQSTARCGCALTTLLLATANMTRTGWTHGVPISPARQAGMLPLLTFTEIRNRLPNSWISLLVVLVGLLFVLISATGVRLTSSRSSLGTLYLHEVLIRACWLRTSMARGM